MKHRTCIVCGKPISEKAHGNRRQCSSHRRHYIESDPNRNLRTTILTEKGHVEVDNDNLRRWTKWLLDRSE